MLLWALGACALLGGLLYLVVDPWTVPSDDPQLAASIAPTLSVADLVLVARSTGASDAALVRCADPDAPGRFVIGRVVAHAGEHLELVGGALTIDGKAVAASVTCDPSRVHIVDPKTQEEQELSCNLEELGGYHSILRNADPSKADPDVKADVEAGRVYLLSDNRVMHLDSRDFKTVLASSCQRIVLRLWSSAGWLDAKNRLTVLW